MTKTPFTPGIKIQTRYPDVIIGSVVAQEVDWVV